MGFFSKRVDRQLQAYQQELIETHYREVDNMYSRSGAGGTTTGITSRL